MLDRQLLYTISIKLDKMWSKEVFGRLQWDSAGANASIDTLITTTRAALPHAIGLFSSPYPSNGLYLNWNSLWMGFIINSFNEFGPANSIIIRGKFADPFYILQALIALFYFILFTFLQILCSGHIRWRGKSESAILIPRKVFSWNNFFIMIFKKLLTQHRRQDLNDLALSFVRIVFIY